MYCYLPSTEDSTRLRGRRPGGKRGGEGGFEQEPGPVICAFSLFEAVAVVAAADECSSCRCSVPFPMFAAPAAVALLSWLLLLLLLLSGRVMRQRP